MITRRQALAGLAGTAGLAATGIRPARAADRVRFLTDWYAQAEHGAFYQAKATGIYARHGLDVTVTMGGPQLNGMQLLAAGEADLATGYPLPTLIAVQRDLPIIMVATSYQFDLQGIMAHSDITSLSQLRGHRILLAGASHATFWPWLRERYGYTDDQCGQYMSNLQPFFTDPTLAQQAYLTAEPYVTQQAHVPISFFLLAKLGYPPYGSSITTTTGYLAKNPDVVGRFVAATMEGWKSYLHDPAPGNALIKIDNPKMTDGLLDFAVKKLRSSGVLTGGDAAKHSIGIMTDARWKQIRDFGVRTGLLENKPGWQAAYTLDYVKNLHVVV
jgi:NitT/TauT family transport system substrate-binding protein